MHTRVGVGVGSQTDPSVAAGSAGSPAPPVIRLRAHGAGFHASSPRSRPSSDEAAGLVPVDTPGRKVGSHQPESSGPGTGFPPESSRSTAVIRKQYFSSFEPLHGGAVAAWPGENAEPAPSWVST